jgi:RND family efflux transporter MFP subunit
MKFVKLNLAVALICAALIFSGCSAKESENNEVIRPVKTAAAVVKSSEVMHNFPGIIKANKDSKLAFRVSGTIEELFFDEGEYVKEGEVIARIDDRDYKLQVTAAKARYEEVSAEVERIVELFKRNSVSQSDYEKAVAGRTMAEAKYQSALNQLEDTTLRAPFSGHIQNIYFDDHETISKGIPAVSMVDVSNLKVETDIPSKVYLQKDNFTLFSCTPEEFPQITMPLKLKGIRKKSNLNELYKIVFILENDPSSKLAPGMIVDVKITIDNLQNKLLTVPANAVFNLDGKSLVWVLDSHNKTTLREVEIGDLNADGSISVFSGLNENEIVVTAGVHSLKENQQVKVIEETSIDNVGGLL